MHRIVSNTPTMLFVVLFGLGSATNCVNGPCCPGNEQCGDPFGRDSPQFHVTNPSCKINDPNGTVYDARHKMYHLFYQDHLAEGKGHGPIYGHACSRDMIHWARLPVASELIAL